MLAVSFAAEWMRTGRHAKPGPILNWKSWPPPLRRPKKGLPANLQNEIVQEVEALLGRPAVQDLDFEALETAARRQALRLAARALEQRLNADTTDHAGPELLCPCGAVAQYHGRHETSKVCSGPCVWREPTITAPNARVDSVRAIVFCGWNSFRSHPECCG